ncbi:Cysteine-rich RLK (receptor-like protein kinase) 8 [Cucumis melo var. makuwa]|uniref:Cysteine-rich RLK (Receptor-like protein kinase) 8 n=1 Tax=Cucumis melo var. makuwa TaxID=1194695 RepID=A0A5D3D6G1_CUCMM|nr:Cysteine-rich RLK (receptor-like protein kinase) 8 [Cucumis melo var. makuwa]TYK19112.1 Cysteine-rich RLK (receptor-like protein kinase) 8 [Cucumis melo var. makuwa]
MEVCFEVCLEEDRTNAMSVLTTPTIDFAAFSARSLNHDSDKNKPILVCEHCKKQWHTKDQCWKLHGHSVISTDDSLAPIAGKGQIVPFGGFALQNVLHVPKLSYNLLPISKITRDFTFLMMIPPVVVYLGLVYCLPTLALLNKIVTTSSGKQWFVTFIDDHTRLTWVYLITDKSEKTYYKRNLRKEVGSPTRQPSPPVQDFEPPRDQGMENPIEPCTNNTMSENNRSDVAVLENVEEKNRGDETEVPGLVLNISFAIMFPMIISPQFRAFIASLDSTIIQKNIYTTIECPEWKNADANEYCLSNKKHMVLLIDTRQVAKLNPIRVLLSVAVNKDWPLYQLDVKNAFLNGDHVEEVYLSPPPGFEAQFGQQLCKLQKSLYFLKQSPRAWFDRFTTFVKSQGYRHGHSNHTLFTNVSKTGKIAVLIVYVDDLVLTGDDQIEISQLKLGMGDEFEIKDLKNLNYFLGMEVA